MVHADFVLAAFIHIKKTPVYVKEQMGHSSINITVDLYGHLIPGSNKKAVEKLDDLASYLHPTAL